MYTVIYELYKILNVMFNRNRSETFSKQIERATYYGEEIDGFVSHLDNFFCFKNDQILSGERLNTYMTCTTSASQRENRKLVSSFSQRFNNLVSSLDLKTFITPLKLTYMPQKTY